MHTPYAAAGRRTEDEAPPIKSTCRWRDGDVMIRPATADLKSGGGGGVSLGTEARIWHLGQASTSLVHFPYSPVEQPGVVLV